MATLLCLSPQTSSIICSIIPAGQRPASPERGWRGTEAVGTPGSPTSHPRWPCQPARVPGIGSMAGWRGPTWLQHPSPQLPPSSSSNHFHSFPLWSVLRDAQHGHGTACQGCGSSWAVSKWSQDHQQSCVLRHPPEILQIHSEALCSMYTSSSEHTGTCWVGWNACEHRWQNRARLNW